MMVARISIMRPVQGARERAEGLLQALDDYLSTQPGYIMGFRFASQPGHGEVHNVGRATVWASREAANHAAGLTHTITLRSELHSMIEPGHIEELFDVVGTPRNLPGI